mgnify:CR=1 FL=1
MMNIQVPITDDERDRINARLASRGVSDISQYIRQLVEEDLDRDAENGERDWVDDLDEAGRAKLEAMLQEGLDDIERGDVIEATPEFWEQLRAKARANVQAKRGDT